MTVSSSAEAGTAIEGTPCAAFLQVENASGIELPATGGIGTAMFIAFGFLAVLGAGVFLITNKRISKEGL